MGAAGNFLTGKLLATVLEVEERDTAARKR
jgi:hypothetical protein